LISVQNIVLCQQTGKSAVRDVCRYSNWLGWNSIGHIRNHYTNHVWPIRIKYPPSCPLFISCGYI